MSITRNCDRAEAYPLKKLVFDLDGTLTVDDVSVSYEDRLPRLDVVARLRAYREDGYEIIIATARSMRTYSGSVGKINVNTLPGVMSWLDRHAIPYDEIHVGKPWCGEDGFYVDDRAVRPSEFASLSIEEINKLLENERS